MMVLDGYARERKNCIKHSSYVRLELRNIEIDHPRPEGASEYSDTLLPLESRTVKDS